MAAPSFETLIKKGTSVTEEQLQTLLRTTDPKGTPYADLLGRHSYNTPEDALAELCKLLGLEFIKDIPVNDIAVDIVRGIPINYAKTQEVLPFKDEADRVIVLTTNPVNHKALEDLRVKFGKRVTALVTTSSR
ncbi:MAG: type II secretion system protein GspE, partial [Calothrix sp. SM1_5_4]|nr:type II secretion system protein GspE [Calothrix sp. SM1_5_4]